MPVSKFKKKIQYKDLVWNFFKKIQIRVPELVCSKVDTHPPSNMDPCTIYVNMLSSLAADATTKCTLFNTCDGRM